MVIAVYRASLTIAGDAPIMCATHRDALPYHLTFRQTPVRRGALRILRSGPSLCFRPSANGRRSLPYRLTLNIFTWSVKNPAGVGQAPQRERSR
ncbi:hypothetical protein PUN4_500015 [Paraburkholderia unamae]|nr:hypothetical protein PUN4_500015 [Paraburkholderia unamae]